MIARVSLVVLLSTVSFAFAAGPTEVSITLETSGPSPVIVVSPATAEIQLGDAVKFVSSGEHDAKIEIKFNDEDNEAGPFPIKKNAKDAIRGLLKLSVGNPLVTLGADRKGEFKYVVKWLTADGTEYELDPTIVVR